MASLLRTLLVTSALALAFSGGAQAAGGHYVFDGGSRAEQSQVRQALNASSFNWSVVQHEYAHQVDFFLLNDTRRAMLAGLGGKAWWATGATASGAPNGTLAHADLTSERFASTLAWAYWPSPSNSMRPTSTSDESAAMAPAAFRSLLARVLAAR